MARSTAGSCGCTPPPVSQAVWCLQGCHHCPGTRAGWSLAGGRGGAGKALLLCSSLGAGGKSFPWETFTVLPVWVCTSGQRDNSLLLIISLDE